MSLTKLRCTRDASLVGFVTCGFAVGADYCGGGLHGSGGRAVDDAADGSSVMGFWECRPACGYLTAGRRPRRHGPMSAAILRSSRACRKADRAGGRSEGAGGGVAAQECGEGLRGGRERVVGHAD